MKDWKKNLPHHTGAFVIGVLLLAIFLLIISRNSLPFSFVPERERPVSEGAPSTQLAELGAPESGVFFYPLEMPDTSSLSYNDAVRLYGEKRIQFVDGCQILPNQVAFSHPSTLLVENRGGQNIALQIENELYPLGPQSFVLVDFQSVGTFPVACSAGQNNTLPNATTIYIQ